MQEFMIALLTCSVTMSILALFYMAITPFLSKRYSVKGRYYAWLIIIVGLIIPFRPQFNNAIVQIDIPSETARTPIIYITPAVQAESELTDIINPAGNASILPSTELFIDNDAVLPFMESPVNDTVLPSVTVSLSWWQITAAIWLIGLITFFAVHIIRHYRFIKIIKRWSETVTDENTLTILQNLKNEMGISKKINLYKNSDIGSPIMVGFINPRILLPHEEIEESELRFVLKHELIHYKRKDLYFKLLVMIATAVHWFNPVVYLMSRAINVQCELSCDEETVRGTDANTRQQYSETIIGVIRYKSKIKTALSTNFYGGKKGMKSRISSIMDTGKKRIGIAVVCIMLIITMGTGIVFAFNTHTAENPTPDLSGINSENENANLLNNKDAPQNLDLGFYTYEEYLEFVEKEKEFFRSMINYIGENWMPVSGEPVLTLEAYERNMANWEIYLAQTLEEIKNGAQIPKLPGHSYPYAVYETLDPYLDLKCRIEGGKWVLYNEHTSIMEMFEAKDAMLEKARWYLSTGLVAGVMDMAQANIVYRRLYNADEENNASLIFTQEKSPLITIPIPPSDSSTIEFAYNRGYRDSKEYTKFADSSFAKRMNNLSEEENDFIFRCIAAGVNIPIADDIVGMITYDKDDSRIMMVVLELENGNLVEFDIRLP